MSRSSHLLVYFAWFFVLPSGQASPKGDPRFEFAAGPAVVTGSMEMKGRTAESALRLDALPGVALSMEYWADESLGAQISTFAGFGADMTTVGGGLVPMNLHQFDLRGRYRWSLSGSAPSPHLIVGMGVRSTVQVAHDQTPSILLDRLILGPQVSSALVLPLMGERLVGTVGIRLGLPFFVRETPADSGDPRHFLHVGSTARLVLSLTERWSIPLGVDFFVQEEEFVGDATRASGTRDVVTKESLLTASVGLAYRP